MIPFNTTTIRVDAPDAADDSGDPYADPAPPTREVWADNVRAVITARRVDLVAGEGDLARMTYLMSCDPCQIDRRCRVTDLTSGVVYSVDECFAYQGTEPLDYVKVHLSKQSDGAVLNQGRY